MALERLIDEKYLVYKDHIPMINKEELPSLHQNTSFSVKIWSDRYVSTCSNNNDDYWSITIFDLFMNDSRQVRFRKSDDQVHSIEIFLLENGFAYVVEYSVDYESFYVNLVQTDWAAGEFHLIDQLKRKCEVLDVLMDPLQPTKLVLRTSDDDLDVPVSYQVCNLVGNKFQVGEKRVLATDSQYYSNGKLIGFKYEYEGKKCVITFYDWATKHEQILELDIVPERFDFVRYDEDRVKQDQMNGFFCFKDIGYGAYGYRNLHFAVKFSNGNFVVYVTAQNDRDDGMVDSKIKVFSIPIQRPIFLRNSAWLLIVRMMKRNGEIDPYQAAKKFLPFNTDLRSAWFENKSESEQSESDESGQESDDDIPTKRVKSN